MSRFVSVGGAPVHGAVGWAASPHTFSSQPSIIPTRGQSYIDDAQATAWAGGRSGGHHPGTPCRLQSSCASWAAMAGCGCGSGRRAGHARSPVSVTQRRQCHANANANAEAEAEAKMACCNVPSPVSQAQQRHPAERWRHQGLSENGGAETAGRALRSWVEPLDLLASGRQLRRGRRT